MQGEKNILLTFLNPNVFVFEGFSNPLLKIHIFLASLSGRPYS